MTRRGVAHPIPIVVFTTQPWASKFPAVAAVPGRQGRRVNDAARRRTSYSHRGVHHATMGVKIPRRCRRPRTPRASPIPAQRSRQRPWEFRPHRYPNPIRGSTRPPRHDSRTMVPETRRCSPSCTISTITITITIKITIRIRISWTASLAFVVQTQAQRTCASYCEIRR